MQDPGERARAWHDAFHRRACDRYESWEHGTLVRATASPGWWDANAVRLEAPGADPGPPAVAALADAWLDGLAHRRVEVWDAEVGERLREPFRALGWDTERLVWMHHAGGRPETRPGGPAVVEVEPGVIRGLRVRWLSEGMAREDAERLVDDQDHGVVGEPRALAVLDGDAAVAFAHLALDGPTGEIVSLFCAPEQRGRGYGRALTAAATALARDEGVRDLFIVADDEDWPKTLYGSLGFRPVWTLYELTRRPPA